MPNNNLNDLSTQQKVESVVEDYDDIAREYAEEFYEDTSDDKYIDRFLSSLGGKSILDAE